jgi:hypothetical protein
MPWWSPSVDLRANPGKINWQTADLKVLGRNIPTSEMPYQFDAAALLIVLNGDATFG